MVDVDVRVRLSVWLVVVGYTVRVSFLVLVITLVTVLRGLQHHETSWRLAPDEVDRMLTPLGH